MNDVEVYGSEKKVQIPFVMGVMADLPGKSEEPLPDIADRVHGKSTSTISMRG